MQLSLLFLAGGLALFGISRLTKTLIPLIRLSVFIATALCFAGIFQMIGSPLTSAMALPPFILYIMCGLGGIIAFLAEQFSLYRISGLQYFATTVLSVLLAAVIYLIIVLYLNNAGLLINLTRSRTWLMILLLFQSFLLFFGFSFPLRLHYQRESRLSELSKENMDDLS